MAEGDAALACEPSPGQEERPYKCKQCPRSYRHAGSLVNHRRTHEVGLFPCVLCHKDFSNPMALKSHLRTHAEEKRHKCPDCGRSFRASSQLGSHRCVARVGRDREEEDEGSSNGGCTSQRGQDTSSSDVDTYSGAEGGNGGLLTNLEKYIADSVVPADFSLLELSVKREAEKGEALQSGRKEAGLQDPPMEERRFKCNQCDKAYKHAGSLTNHKQSHTLGAYQCSLCYKEFSNLMALKSHARLHSEYRPYKCRFCHQAFRLPSELLSHQKAHGEEKGDTAGPPAWDSSDPSSWEEDSIETLAKLDIYQPPPAGADFGNGAPCSLKDTSKAGGGERCHPDGELCVRCGGTFANEEELKGHSCLYPEEANEEEGGGHTPSQLAPVSDGMWEASLKVEGGYPALEERPFRCEDCGRTYRHAGSLINHKKSHQIGVYSCSVCSKQLYNLAALKNHLRVHLKSKLGLPASEEAPQRASTAASDLQREENSPGEPGDCHAQPPDVWGGAASPKEEEEERGGGEEEERPYRCEDCGRSYRHRGSLVNHRHTHQTGVFQCSLCPKQYTNLMALRNHVRVHLRAARLSGREPVDCLTCTSCGESFEEEAEFQLHQLRHLPCSEDIEAAAVPGLEGFHPQEADLLQAIKQDVEALENGSAVAEDVLPSSEAPYVCHLCGMTFASTAGLQNHSLQHRGDMERPDGADERPESPVQRLYGCDLCGKSYRHSGSLINHKQTHQTGDFSCSVCGKHFQNVASLKSHLRGHQRPRRAHSGTATTANLGEDAAAGEGAALPGMPSLAEEFKNSYDLREDGALANGWQLPSDVPSPSPGNAEVPPYLCEQCGTGFDQADDLESHKQTHQSGIYQCSLCPKEYPSLLALKNHFHGHAKAVASSRGSPSGDQGAEEQPFLCSLCGMIFPNEEDLQQHHNSAHEEGEGPAGGEDAELKTAPGARVEDAGDPGEEQLLSHICGYCGETFDDMASLEEHSEGHQEEKAAALADTSIQLRRVPRPEEDPPRLSPAELPAPADGPSDDRPYACSQCGKTYRHGGSLVNHKKIHQVGDYQCGVCCRQYPNLSAYRNHLRNHPKCKLNGSVPEIRPPVTAGEGGPGAGCQKVEPPDGQVLLHEGGKDPPGKLSLLSPGGSGEEAALSGGPPERQKTLAGAVCGEEGSGEKAAQEACRGLHFAEEKQEEEEPLAKEEEAAPAGGEETGSLGAEEEGSPSERPFRCEACGRNYKHAGSLINHKQTHKTGLFHCGVCQKQFYNLMALKNHNRTHFETKRYRCPECPKAFRLQKQLASHQRVHRDRKRDPSSHPSRRPLYARRAGRHENPAHPLSTAKRRPDPEERPYQCGECGRTYRHAGSLLNHQKSHKVGHFACPLCSKAYPNLMSLKNHQRIHYEVKRHRCPDCGKAFKWQRQLLRHQHRPHPCACSAPGQAHKRNQRVPGKERGGKGGESPLGPFHCPVCSKHFSSHTSLRNHARVHSKKRFECSECGKAYRASRDLARHLRRHRAEAGKAERGSSSPSYPNASTPPEEEKEQRPYKCNSCDRTYRHAGSLLNHKKAHATGLYRCPTCQKEFYNLLALKNHLPVHSDKKRHRCPHCGQAFRTARRLAAHAKAHGGPREGGASFTCLVCSKVFFHQPSFQQHQLTHGRDGGPCAVADVPARGGS